MPEVLTGATEAGIQTWLVQPGTKVAVGQALAELETDKAIVELTAESAGIVGRLLAGEGDNVAVGDPVLALISSEEGDDAIDSALAAAGLEDSVATPVASPVASPAATPVASPAPSPAHAEHPQPEAIRQPTGAAAIGTQNVTPAETHAPSAQTGRQFVSPIVRRLAKEHGVDPTNITGTGPGGRIVRRDLERHLAADGSATVASRDVSSSPSDPPHATAGQSTRSATFEDFPLNRMRRAIARRLTESKATVPHFYLVADCDVDALLALRTEINKGARRKISVNDFVLKAAAHALTDVPAANAIWNEDSIRRYSTVDVAVAVATDGGLMTPVVRGIERMPLSEVSATVADLAERARAGRLQQRELEGGSFAISNLGMYGTRQFTAILNPPQSGILAVGAARKAPTVTPDGELTVASLMTVTLSADHRVLDGAIAAEWLAAFHTRIENPLTILI